MYNIISYSSKRMIRILKVFIQNDMQYSINELSESLNISTKTLTKDFKELNKYFADIDGLYLTYKNSNDKIDTNLSIENFIEIQSKILLDSLIIKFIFELLEKPYRDINYYSDKLYTSKSSIYRMINEFNNYFKAFQVKITSDATLYYLDCHNEYNFRRFVTGFLLEVYGNDVFEVLDVESFEFINKRLLKMYQSNEATISDYYVDYYTLFYSVSLKREKEGNQIEYSPQFTGHNVEFTDGELEILNQMERLIDIKQLHAIESTIFISNYLLTSLVKREDLLIVKEFLDLIYREFDLNTETEEQNYLFNIFMDVYIDVKYYRIPYPFLNDRFVFFSNNIQKTHVIFFNRLKELLHYFESTTGISLHKYEHFLVYTLVITNPEILNYVYSKPILITSGVSKEHAGFILDYLKKELKIFSIFIDNTTTAETSEVTESNILDYSLVVSDIAYDIEHNIVVDKFPFFEEHIEKIKNHLLS
ncbi:helix-turn-helix domain-containing protein [Vagococcus fluvialis]|uniref:helix-turn-helix domain-containing protein n=1 Tax=Vagococcus fluvialis TaxID=2738 RepID=UPI001A8E5F40|nr:helix-turn-helix domain-containing protein [Vagococcus fluvialis]MBO0419856.1 helix-turn-helix domain-containing protein [Vagococcus fluvialis]